MKLDLSKEIDRQKANAYFLKLLSEKAKVEIKKYSNPRSINQNGYLHVCLAYFCLETGYSINEAKDVFASMLPDLMQYEKNGMRFRRSTSDLNTKEMTLLIDTIRSFCNDQLGIYIPTSEQYYADKFNIDRELQSVL